MTYNELMIQSLSDLLEGDEILKFPIYGTLLQKNAHWFGFFGLTDTHLLVALLKGSSKKIEWTSRVPLDVKAVKIKKSLLPFQYKVKIEFHEGLPCHLQASKKSFGIKSQEENILGFINYIQAV